MLLSMLSNNSLSSMQFHCDVERFVYIDHNALFGAIYSGGVLATLQML